MGRTGAGVAGGVFVIAALLGACGGGGGDGPPDGAPRDGGGPGDGATDAGGDGATDARPPGDGGPFDAGCVADIDCDDDNACTADVCTALGCTNDPLTDGAPCEEACVTGGTCQSGVCEGDVPDADGDGEAPVACGGLDCDDDEAAVDGSREEGDAVCDDGLDNDCDGVPDRYDGSCADALCLGDWCWDFPRPQGEDIDQVVAFDADHVWYVLESGRLLYRDAGRYSLVEGLATDGAGDHYFSPDGQVWLAAGDALLHAADGTGYAPVVPGVGTPGPALVDGSSATDVWVLYVDTDELIHFDGTDWTLADTGALSGDFRSLAVDAAGVVFVGSSDQQVHVLASGTWTSTTVGEAGSQSIFNLGSDEGEVVAEVSDVLYRYAAGSWTATLGEPPGVFTDDGRDLKGVRFRLGGSPTLESYVGDGGWATLPGYRREYAWGSTTAAGDIWYGGRLGAMGVHLAADSTSYRMEEVAYRDFEITGADRTAWGATWYHGTSRLVGGFTRNLRDRGGVIESFDVPDDVTIHDMVAVSETEIWFAGGVAGRLSTGPFLQRWDGEGLTDFAAVVGTEEELFGGPIARLLRYDDGTYATVHLSTSSTRPASRVTAWDGSAWVLSRFSHELYDGWGASPDDVWVVGTQSYRGPLSDLADLVVPASVAPNDAFLTVWGAGADDVYLGGGTAGDGRVVRWDGAELTLAAGGLPAPVVHLTGRGGSEVWALLEDGSLQRYDGSTWTPVAGPPLPTTRLGEGPFDATRLVTERGVLRYAP